LSVGAHALERKVIAPGYDDPRETWADRARRVMHRIYRDSAANEAMDRLEDDEHLGGRNYARLPNPHTCVDLGLLCDVHVAEIVRIGREYVPTGTLLVYRWIDSQRPRCLWSRRLSAVLAFGGVELGPPLESLRGLDEDVKIFRKWHIHREPWGASRMSMPDPEMLYAGPAIAVTYESSKRNTNGAPTKYIHHHEPGVGLWVSKEKRGVPGRTAMMLRGGQLRIAPNGMIAG
jgi:hypothetical protein